MKSLPLRVPPPFKRKLRSSPRTLDESDRVCRTLEADQWLTVPTTGLNLGCVTLIETVNSQCTRRSTRISTSTHEVLVDSNMCILSQDAHASWPTCSVYQCVLEVRAPRTDHRGATPSSDMSARSSCTSNALSSVQ
eukprot:2253724-Prymnesium_polylepis.1